MKKIKLPEPNETETFGEPFGKFDVVLIISGIVILLLVLCSGIFIYGCI